MSEFEDLEYKSEFSPNGLYDKGLAEKLLTIFSKYKFFDLCRAIFCINAWRYNRAHLNFYLTLNYALTRCLLIGNKPIDKYDDFIEFFNELSPYLNSQFDDEIVPDFGDIKISFNNNFYPVFIGTGYNFMYPMMMSLYALSSCLNIELQMEEVLRYVKDMVDTLAPSNMYVGEKNLFILYLPDEAFFSKCKGWYKIIDLKNSNVLKQLVNTCTTKIEETHFINNADNYYPLFNPSIIVDSFHSLGKSLINDKKEAEAAYFAVYTALQNNFALSSNSKNLLLQVGIIEDLKKYKIAEQLLFDFAIIDEKSVLFLINEHYLEDKNLQNVINLCNNLLQQKRLKVVEFNRDGKSRIINLHFCEQVEFIVYDSEIFFNNGFKLGEEGKILSYYFYDLLTIFYRAKSVSDIVDFLKYKNKANWQYYGLSGNSAIFEAWVGQNKEIMQGAWNANLITTDVYLVEWNVFKEYLDLNEWYPFKHYTEFFAYPSRWIINKEYDQNFLNLRNKAVFGYGGSFRKVDNSYLFLAYNFAFENLNEKADYRHEAICLVEDLNFRSFVLYEDALKKCGLYNFIGVHITYMPMNYAEKVDNNGFLKQKNKYVFSDYCFADSRLLIRYAVDEERLLHDIVESVDKKVECEYFQEMLSCVQQIDSIDFEYLRIIIDQHRNDKKDIEAIQVELKYYYSQNNLGLKIDDEYYVKVRKLIANDCKKANIVSGLYSSENATIIIRKLQELIIPHFESAISKYNKYELHKRLLSVLAFNVHNKNLNFKRYSMVNKDSISEEARDTTSKRVIKSREQNKDNIRDILYLIETNLSIIHDGDKDIFSEDLKYLVAYAHWLIVLQDNADNAHYNLFETKIQIEDDFRVSTVLNEEQTELTKIRNRRIYDNNDYRPKLQCDEENLKQATKCFQADTGVKLRYVFLICEYFYREFNFTFKDEICEDIFELSENEIKNDIGNWLKEFSDDELENVFKALDYLIIDESKIKTSNGKTERFVPIWQREGRDFRFDIRPLIRNGDKIIFSPVVVYELSIMWESGIFDFYLPYEYGLDNLRTALMKWKTECEKQMEKDIEIVFKDMGYITRRNLQLHKLDKKYGHPSDLGDYDVLAVDEVNKVVWNIESKFLNKVGSLREYYNHQDSFFIRNKKDEKFSRRITYLESNVTPILHALGIIDCKNYSVKNYMVTNKVFYADIKKVNFDIVSFCELKQLINKFC